MENISSKWDPSFDEEVRKFWKEYRIYEKWRLKNLGKEKYRFLEGPPYTTGNPHLGHTWNRALKDMVIRYRIKKGFDVWVQAGFDMHGLPIEEKVERKLNIKNKKEIEKVGVDKFIKECKNLAYGSMKRFYELYEKLAHWQDIDNPYLPIKNEYIEKVWGLVKKAHEKGLLYESEKPIWWCPRCQTSLAKHEIELGYIDSARYKPAIDPSIIVKFPIKGEENMYLLVWTTTPWTLTYNLGVMVNPNEEYVILKVNKFEVEYLDLDEKNKKINEKKYKQVPEEEYWIIAKALYKRILEKLGIENYEVVDVIKGEELEGTEYIPPFYEELKDILDDLKQKYNNAFRVWLSEEYVTTEEGTGLVHSAPGCGPEDYEVGLKYGVQPFNTVDEEGYIRNLPVFDGWRAKFDDLKWVDMLIKKGLLVDFEWYEHDYPICWRCGTRLIIRTTKQWFFNVQSIKESTIQDLDNDVNFIPDFAKLALKNNIQVAPDWVITRQRYWGIPLPIWRCKNGHIKVIGSIEELEKEANLQIKTVYIALRKTEYAEKMLKIYFNQTPKYLNNLSEFDFDKFENKDLVIVENYSEDDIEKLSRKYNVIRSFGQRDYELLTVSNFDLHKPFVDNIVLKCNECGEEMKRIPDVLDVWIDSGSSTFATGVYPVDFILEGIDQLRGWFYSLAILGKIYFDKVPYRNVYVHGFVLDSKGLKMSKSLGNVIDPFDLIEKYGADAVRLYLSSAVKAYEDAKIDPTEIKNKLNSLNVLWNTHRYLIEMSRYYGIDPTMVELEKEELQWEDKYMLHRLEKTKQHVEKLLEDYKLWQVGRELENLYLELSRFYIKSIRERLSEDPKIVLGVIYKVLFDTINMLSIVTPYITERIYQNLKSIFGLKEESVHLLSWPNVNERWIDDNLERQKELLDKIVELGLRLRDTVRIPIRWPLKSVIISLKNDKYSDNDINIISSIVKRLLNVKEVLVQDDIKATENVVENLDMYLTYDFEQTEELLKEGYLREIQRRLQDARKRMGLRKGQKVVMYVWGDEYLLNIVSENKEYLESVSDSSIVVSENIPTTNVFEYTIKEHRLKIGVSLS